MHAKAQSNICSVMYSEIKSSMCSDIRPDTKFVNMEVEKPLFVEGRSLLTSYAPLPTVCLSGVFFFLLN